MVAISLYKGNLHKVPDVPRKWLMPTRQITVKDFKTLLRRRSRALSRLPNPNPNPNPNDTDHHHNDNNYGMENAINTGVSDPESGIPQLEEPFKGKDDKGEENVGDGAGGEMGSEGGDCLGKMEVYVSDSAVVEAKREVDWHNIAMENELNIVAEEKRMEKEEDAENPNAQDTLLIINKDAAESSEGTRKKEIEERLKVLKEKKHTLVQVLKQIQTAEEELKRRSSPQGVMVRPGVPLQVDIPNDTGSITRLNTPRVGLDGILGAEVEGEPDGLSNHNTDTRHMLRMSSTSPSPSSDSTHKKPAFTVVPHSARTTLGVSASPSRFAPTGQQVQTPNLPTVSVSGTNYVASSPSPAASGGTSVFRENSLPSPWN